LVDALAPTCHTVRVRVRVRVRVGTSLAHAATTGACSDNHARRAAAALAGVA